MEVYRISLSKWSHSLRASGRAARWNSEGREVIYAAASRSLACLENIVHRNSTELIDRFRVMVFYIPDHLKTETVYLTQLTEGWNSSNENAYRECRRIGDSWLNQKTAPLLKVPSSIIKNEFNYLLDPFHPDFKNIKLIDNEPFLFDSRLKD
ncbi:MAG: RES family NAD+ phosphorylase [Bacteroidales bacterium]|nr:RES family NAD+ phosphorylase [Bacteroidales bacterium]MCF8338860.1 RES family NAD+ phosphorylase [Bacteroidales bacterium]